MIKFDSNRLIFGLFLIVLVAIGYLIIDALQVPTWPAFMAMIFFLMAKGDKKTALPILVGGTVGILSLVLAKFFVMGVGPTIGLVAAKLIFIMLLVYVIVAFAEIIPIFVNIYTFMFFLIAALAINVPNPNPKMAPFVWIGVLLIGGGLFILGIMGIYKILTAIVLKKAAKAK